MVHRPKPSKIRELEGNRGKRAIPAELPPRGAPIAPKTRSAEVSRLFHDLVRSMPDGVYSQSDSSTLELYAIHWARWRQAQRHIERHGLWIDGGEFKNGEPKGEVLNPNLKIQRYCEEVMFKLTGELGLSPSARTRIVAKDRVDEDPLALLLDGRQDGAYYTPAPTRKTTGAVTIENDLDGD